VHREAAAEALTAFAEPGALEREFTLPELGRSFPGIQVVAFHFVDYVVHAWGVAAALGVRLHLTDEVRGAALAAVARLVPTDAEYRAPRSAFAPALEVPESTGPLEEALWLPSRSPGAWPTPALTGRDHVCRVEPVRHSGATRHTVNKRTDRGTWPSGRHAEFPIRCGRRGVIASACRYILT
jgi:hypothetical protein